MAARVALRAGTAVRPAALPQAARPVAPARVVARTTRDVRAISATPPRRSTGRSVYCSAWPCSPGVGAGGASAPNGLTDRVKFRSCERPAARRDATQMRDCCRVGGGGLCPSQPIAGGVGNPLRVPMSTLTGGNPFGALAPLIEILLSPSLLRNPQRVPRLPRREWSSKAQPFPRDCCGPLPPPHSSVKYVQYSPSSFVAGGALATRRLGPNFNQ